MSMGYCGKAVLTAEDEFTAIYQYCGENWNADSEARGDINVLDGGIVINKACLVEPEIHRKNRKGSNKKRIIQPFSLSDFFENGDIEITKPCTSEFSHGVGIGAGRMYFACRLLHKIFVAYQEEGQLPKQCSFIV